MLRTLKTFLPIAEKVWDRKTSLPILHHICVENGNIRMTDLEMSVKAPVDDKRAYTIPIKLLKKILNTKPKELSIKLTEESKAKIIFDTKSVTFPFESADDYPQEQKEQYEEAGSWTKEVLLKLYNQLPFTSTDELRAALTGVYVEQNNKLSSCATDGHVLKYITNLDATSECTLRQDLKVILPAKCIQILAKFARGDVKVFSGKERIKFILPGEIGIFVRSEAELNRAKRAVEDIGLPFIILDETIKTTSSHVSISTMHLAKGLEFRTVVVMACDDEVIPSQDRIETVVDDSDLDEVYNTERHLLYVACTRARDHLLITSVDPVSEFVDDLRM